MEDLKSFNFIFYILEFFAISKERNMITKCKFIIEQNFIQEIYKEKKYSGIYLKLKKNSENALNTESNQLFKTNYEKFKYKKMWGNVIILTMFSRYIDIIVKVKFGGSLFLILSGSLLFTFNNFYTNYYLYSLLNILSKEKNKSVLCLIEEIHENYLLKTKDQINNEKQLSKYWKEPMAWH